MRAAISKILYQSYRAGKRYGEGKAEPESYNRTTDKVRRLYLFHIVAMPLRAVPLRIQLQRGVPTAGARALSLVRGCTNPQYRGCGIGKEGSAYYMK